MAVTPALDGVPETALWTLYLRSVEARRPDRMFADPLALAAVDGLDYPFDERFGRLFPAQASMQAMRVMTFDACVSAFLRDCPYGTVVSLGEGLETQFWRVDNGTVRWVTVDLPESIAVREAVLPANERMVSFAGSAFDPKWTELVDPSEGVLIIAQGLLVYFPPELAHELIAMCANAFPGGAMVVDAIGTWMARFIERGGHGYRPPPLPWTLSPAQLPGLRRIHPNIGRVSEVRPVAGRGLLGWIGPRLRHVPLIGRLRPMIVKLWFSA